MLIAFSSICFVLSVLIPTFGFVSLHSSGFCSIVFENAFCTHSAIFHPMRSHYYVWFLYETVYWYRIYAFFVEFWFMICTMFDTFYWWFISTLYGFVQNSVALSINRNAKKSYNNMSSHFQTDTWKAFIRKPKRCFCLTFWPMPITMCKRRRRNCRRWVMRNVIQPLFGRIVEIVKSNWERNVSRPS